MKVTRTITIQAPPETVWQKTIDVERWPQWSPNIQSVKRLDTGRFDVGSRARIKQLGLPETTWQVSSLRSGKAFTWQTRVRGITMIGSHDVEPVASIVERMMDECHASLATMGSLAGKPAA